MPLGFSIYTSMYECRYMSFARFMGFDNFIKVLSNKDYLMSFGTTFYVSLMSLAISLTFGVIMALWIHKRKGIFAYSIQLIILIPWVGLTRIMGTCMAVGEAAGIAAAIACKRRSAFRG